MTALLVILLILILLLIFLFSPITATVNISESTDFKISYLGIKFFPLKKKPAKKEKPQKNDKKKLF